MKHIILCCAVVGAMLAAPIAGAQLERITSQEAADGLRVALERGSVAAVAGLGRPDGFLGDARVKIPLPESLQRAEKAMRRFGLGKHADELLVAINRAAEAAVPEAKNLFIDAVKAMTLQDAKNILLGGDTAGTQYFRGKTQEPLRARFLPIVQSATAKVGLAQAYNNFAAKGVRFGLVSKDQADLDAYVTEKALDGLFFMVGEEEKKIRKDPVGTATDILKKVFGALR